MSRSTWSAARISSLILALFPLKRLEDRNPLRGVGGSQRRDLALRQRGQQRGDCQEQKAHSGSLPSCYCFLAGGVAGGVLAGGTGGGVGLAEGTGLGAAAPAGFGGYAWSYNLRMSSVM